jgi:hypothetical protein
MANLAPVFKHHDAEPSKDKRKLWLGQRSCAAFQAARLQGCQE